MVLGGRIKSSLAPTGMSFGDVSRNHRVGLKGADRYANPDDGEPNGVRRTTLDEQSESSGTSTEATGGSEARSESRERIGRGLSRWFSCRRR